MTCQKSNEDRCNNVTVQTVVYIRFFRISNQNLIFLTECLLYTIQAVGWQSEGVKLWWKIQYESCWQSLLILKLAQSPVIAITLLPIDQLISKDCVKYNQNFETIH